MDDSPLGDGLIGETTTVEVLGKTEKMGVEGILVKKQDGQPWPDGSPASDTIFLPLDLFKDNAPRLYRKYTP